MTVFRNGPITYLALLRDYKLRDYESYPATVTLPGKLHVYDMRSG